jgi:hypothetical protein
MMPKRKKAIRFVVALLVLSISQVYVSASLTMQGTQAQNASNSATPMVGRLEVHGGKHILVDKDEAESGYTVLDGQVLETSNCTSATVHLLPVTVTSSPAEEIGAVELATNTKAVINYNAGEVKVTLARGCSRVGISQAIDTTIVAPDGSSVAAAQRDPADLKRAELCFPSRENREYRPSCVAPIVFGVAGAATLLTLALVRPCSSGQDTSPTSPTGGCL